MINAGNIENKGVEVAFNATPYISEWFPMGYSVELVKEYQQGNFIDR